MKRLILLVFLLLISISSYSQTYTFCALSQNCAWTGNNTWSGTSTFNGPTAVTANSVSGATPVFNAALGNVQILTLTSNVSSSTLINAVIGQSIFFIVCENTTGNYSFTWPANVKGAPPINNNANACTYVDTMFDGTYADASSRDSTSSLVGNVITPFGTNQSLNFNTTGTGLSIFNSNIEGSSGTLGITGNASTTGNVAIGGNLAVTGTTTLTGGFSGPLFDEGGGVYNIKAYGATGNGTTDDTVDTQAAITAASSTGGEVFIPQGNYRISSTLSVTNPSVSIVGIGKLSSYIYYTGTGPAIEFTGGLYETRYGNFGHFGIACTNKSGTSGIEINPNQSYLANYFGDIFSTGCGNGTLFVQGTSSVYNEETEMSQIVCSNDTYCVHFSGDGGSFGYTNIDMYCEMNSIGTDNGACFRVDDAFWYNSTVNIRTNLTAQSTPLTPNVIEAGPYAQVGPGSRFYVVGEGSNGSLIFAADPNALVTGVELNGQVKGADTVPYIYGTYSNWSSGTYTVAQTIKSNCSVGDIMQVMVAGTTNSSQPTWNCGLDDTTVDGTVTWRDVGQSIGPNGNGGYKAGIFNKVLYSPNGSGIAIDGTIGEIVLPVTPESGCTNGSTYTNYQGASGSMYYICQAGAWVDIK